MATMQTTPQYEVRITAILIQVTKEQPFRDVVLLGPGNNIVGYALWTPTGHEYRKEVKETELALPDKLWIGVYAMIV